jgi:Transcriptional regulator, AbiEi antitoxin, Type IV TA system/Transcriptional regulator, AbiEi antitoxin N-terminal domain
MSILTQHKLNHLLQIWPKNAVFLASYLRQLGYSNQLLVRYKKSNWIRSVGRGAYTRQEDRITLEGSLYALQVQAGLSTHQGGKHALSLLGKAHYIELNRQRVDLFGGPHEQLPAWFKNQEWDFKRLNYFISSFLPRELGLATIEVKEFHLKISTAVRAIMECIYLAPDRQDLMECLQLMQGLNNMRPKVVQEMLENCKSIKVKRLFLYFAEKAGHDWLNRLNTEKIDLGSGKRSLGKGGVFIPKYQITVPPEIASYDSEVL